MAPNTDEILAGRRLPYSMEAEQSVLGSVLVRPECINDIVSLIHADDFYVSDHQSIFLAMMDLFTASKSIDHVTLIDYLVKRGVYDTAEKGKAYVVSLIDAVPSSRNVVDYAMIVRDRSIDRRLISAGEEIVDFSYRAEEPADRLVETAEQLIYEISDNSQRRDFVPIQQILLNKYKELKELANDPHANRGTQTGFTALDNILVGMGKGDLILVGARPGMGKTSFALNIATNVARNTGKAVCIFSLEMSNEQLVTRMLSSEALVDSYRLRSGTLMDEDWTNLARTSSMLSECQIYLDDESGITVAGMKSKLRRVKNLGFIVIDYLQLMTSDRKIDNRVQEIGEISRALKIMAKDFNVPVMVCAQLSRGPESRQDKRPMLSDLRDSGAIEQDADVVMFLYRDQYYDKNPTENNKAEVIIAKNRHGSTSTVEMTFQGQFTRFYSMDSSDRAPAGG